MRSLLGVCAAALALAACTPNAVALNGGGAPPPAGTPLQTIDVNLTGHAPFQGTFGVLAGYAPNPSNVAVGTAIVFHNSESFPHTASAISGSAFPLSSPFSTAALQASGAHLGDAGWSSGELQAGASSAPLLVSAPGVYLYGCFFHYGSPMRGAIVAK
ncbi:MAG: hypothetical protein KGM44_11325 [bacterium]|nr:hypothetical protein [bacterium]